MVETAERRWMSDLMLAAAARVNTAGPDSSRWASPGCGGGEGFLDGFASAVVLGADVQAWELWFVG